MVAWDAEIPARLRKLVEDYLAVDDWDDALRRSDVLGDLVGELEDQALEEAATADDITGGPACEPEGQEPPALVLDQAVEKELRTAQDEVDLSDRLDLLAALGRLVGEWERYCLDEEKLLGHLIVAHEAKDQVMELEQQELFALHAEKHRTGARHLQKDSSHQDDS